MPSRQQAVPNCIEDDHLIWTPPKAISAVPVGSIAYSEEELNATAGLNALVATSTGAVSAIFEADLLNALHRLTPGRGTTVTDIVVAYAITTLALSGPLVGTLREVQLPVVGTPAAPAVTSLPLGAGTGLQTAVTGAGVAASGKFAVTTPLQITDDLAKLVFRLVVPCQNTSVFHLLGIAFHCSYQMSALPN